MESKVMLIDADGNEVGETYSRRARQLVKQQRAIWANDSHTAIQFMPDEADEWDIPKTPVEAPPEKEKSSHLYALAEKRIQDRRRFLWHTLLLIPVVIFIPIIMTFFSSGRRWDELHWLFLGLCWGAWIMSYFYRVKSFYKEYGYIVRARDSGNLRYKMRIEAEMEYLKRLGYRD